MKKLVATLLIALLTCATIGCSGKDKKDAGGTGTGTGTPK